MTRGGMDHHSGRLVNHQDGFVLVNHREGNVFGQDVIVGNRRYFTMDGLAFPESVTRLGRMVPEPDGTIFNQLLDLGPG